MAIQIIDGFELNSSSPIDNRIVASGSSDRNSIAYKYDGLRVFDTYDQIPYVWVNGAWQSENVTNVSGSGTISYLPLFTSSNVIGNSIIFQGTNSNIGISITHSATEKLEIGGNVKAGNFIGGGVGITNISADNIDSGDLSLSRITNGNNGYLLAGGSAQPQYINPSNVSVGTSSVSLSTSAISVNVSSLGTSNYILFATASSGYNSPRVSSNITYDAVNSYLILGNGVKIGNTSTNTITSSGRYSSSYVGVSTHVVTAATIAVTYSTTIHIEASFSSKTISSTSSINQSNKFIITLSVNSSGTISIIGSQSTIHSANNNTGGRQISDGYVDYSANSILSFKQSVYSTVSHDFYTQVYYSIMVT